MARRRRKVGGPGSYSFKVENALDVADRVLQGEKITGEAYNPLAWLESFLGLDKPFTSYAKRTRQRYVSGARRGKTAPQIRAEEKAQRQARVTAKYGAHITPSQATTLNRLKREIADTGVEIGYYLEDDVVRDFLTNYGYRYLKTVWTMQLESIHAYAGGAGSVEPGRSRWFSRGTLEDQYTPNVLAVYFPHGVDPYYYYHGRSK